MEFQSQVIIAESSLSQEGKLGAVTRGGFP